MVINFMVP